MGVLRMNARQRSASPSVVLVGRGGIGVSLGSVRTVLCVLLSTSEKKDGALGTRRVESSMDKAPNADSSISLRFLERAAEVGWMMFAGSWKDEDGWKATWGENGEAVGSIIAECEKVAPCKNG